MQMQLVADVTATLTATEYPTIGYNTPFLPGNTVVGMLVKDGDFAGDNITIRTDNSQSAGSPAWETIRAAADGDLATTPVIELFEFVLGDNIEITAATITAGGFKFYLLS